MPESLQAGTPRDFSTDLRRLVGFLGRYEVALTVLVVYLAFFNLMDMLSTALALRIGLEESNSLLLGLTSGLRMNLLTVIGLAKVLFVFGGAGLAYMGVKSNNRGMKNLIFGSILFFVLVFLFVSINNIYLILY